MLSDSIKEIIDHSILFGRFLNESLRRRLFDYILYKFHKIQSIYESKITDDLTPYVNFVNKVIVNSDVASLAENNNSIFTDILTRMIKVFEHLEKEINITGEFQKEELELSKMKNFSLNNFLQQFEKNMEKIKIYNPEKDFNIPFFQYEYEKLKISNVKNVNKQKLALKNDILERWEANILKKKYLTIIKRIDEERNK